MTAAERAELVQIYRDIADGAYLLPLAEHDYRLVARREYLARALHKLHVFAAS